MVVVAAEAIRPYVQGLFINDLRPSGSRMISFLQALGKP
jgi:hypothetical protein